MGRWEVTGLGHSDVDVTDAESVWRTLEPLEPAVVVNTAAFHKVDLCEQDPRRAFEVNALGALHVARACERIGALCIFISTDYVFDGAKRHPYTESDVPNPLNVYGVSKLAGEALVRQAASRWIVVRVASLFGKGGARGKGGNFVTTILSRALQGEPLRVVTDIVMSPTYVRDAAEAIERLAVGGMLGVFHVTNAGECSWYEFAQAILEESGIDRPIEPLRSQDMGSGVRRPLYSALACDRLRQELGIELPPWRDALRRFLVELQKDDSPGVPPERGGSA
jgi:dTDP-4-dehydrorhamnose reductase